MNEISPVWTEINPGIDGDVLQRSIDSGVTWENAATITRETSVYGVNGSMHTCPDTGLA